MRRPTILRRRPATPLRLAGAALVAIATGSACGGRDAGTAEISGEVIAVTVMPARVGSVRDVITAGGTVVPSSIADHLVTAAESAEIIEITKNEGDTVQTGDVLVRLDVPSITNAVATLQLELSDAVSRFEAAKAEDERMAKFAAQGLAARNQAEAARAARVTAETHLASVRGRFQEAKALEGSTAIRARFPGIVAKRWHVAGDLVAGGEADPILRVIDPSKLQVALQVPAEQASRVSLGQPTTIQTGTGAELAVVGAKGTPSSADAPTVEVRLTFAAPTTLAIDTIVQAEILLEERQNVLVVPASAVQRDDNGVFVWIVNDNSQATRRDIRLGLSAGGVTQVSSGLAAGDQVILTGIAQLSEGKAVVIG